MEIEYIKELYDKYGPFSIQVIDPCKICGMNKFCKYGNHCHYCREALCLPAYIDHMQEVASLILDGKSVHTTWGMFYDAN